MSKKEGLIGYIFPDRNGGFMIDTGPEEYSSSLINSFEIWDGLKYVPAIKEDIMIPQMTGTKARFNVTVNDGVSNMSIDYDYDGLDVIYEPDDPDDDPICSGCLKDFVDPFEEISYIVPRMSPDGVSRLGIRYYCKKCASAAKRRRPDGWDANRDTIDSN